MLYLIYSKTIIKDYLHSPELKEVSDFSELVNSLLHKIFSISTPFNCDFLITYSEFKKLSSRDNNHTKKHIEQLIKFRLAMIGGYKKKNIDVFILETSNKNYDEVCLKLSSMAKLVGVNFDYMTFTRDNISKIKEDYKPYYTNHINTVIGKNVNTYLRDEFFRIKKKYNRHKIPNMNRLTTNGLSKVDGWFKNGYVSYKHILAFARKDLVLHEGKTDEKTLFKLFGYLPSDSEYFTDTALKYIKKLITSSEYTTHKLAMILEYYRGNKIDENKCYDYKPPYEYLLLGSKRNIDRQFVIYLSLALGLSLEEIRTLFKKCNCFLTDYLKEDILLSYFAENNYLLEVKQRGLLFRYLRESI